MGIGPVKRRAVFLDRDGVLNRALLRDGKPYPPSGPQELEVLPGVADALERLRAAGYLLIVVTNQPDVARGTSSREAVEELNSLLAAQVPVDDFRVCYHDDQEDCVCRKPKPGLLLRAARDYDLHLPACWMVGDRWRDVDAGAAAGCRTVWIDRGYRERGPTHTPDLRVMDLCEAVRNILDISERER